MSLPTSSASVRFLFPADVAALHITTVAYRLYGENFEVTGKAPLDPQKRSVTLSFPAGFFSVTPDHRPLIGPSDDVPVHAAGYYGVTLSGAGASAQPPQVGFPSGDSLLANLILERGTNTGERTPVLSLARGDVDTVYSIKQHWETTTQTVRNGDLVTVAGPRGFWTGTTTPFVSRQAVLGSDLNNDSFVNIPLSSAVSADGSKLTLTIRDRAKSTADFNKQPGAAPLIAMTMMTGLLFGGVEDADYVAVYMPVRTVPGAPTVGRPIAGQSSATVRWTTPTNGGAAILGYRVRAYAGTKLVATKLVIGPARSAVVTGLKNGTAYTFDVAAANRVGIGPVWKRSSAVTPRR